jgi:hypothetical protein
MQPELRSRLRRRCLAFLLGALLALLCAECALRWLVLSDSSLARRLGKGFRHPELYASWKDDDFWKLMSRFEPAQGASALWPDRRTGWRNCTIEAGTYAHADEAGLGGRTPVLLYGDSFAEGGQTGPETFQGLLQASDLQQRFALLNYGVGGYGADQILLLAQASLPRFQSREPVAILALLVDDDLERASLGFRGGPKPQLRVVHGELAEPEPVEPNLQLYLAQHPIGITSYCAALLCNARGLLPLRLQAWLRGDAARLADRQQLAEAIVRAACRELRARAQRSALLLMRGQDCVRFPEAFGWQEALLRRVAAEEGLPVLDSRAVLLEAIAGRLERLHEYYVESGPRVGHWNGSGNLAVFQLMHAFLEGGTQEDALARIRELVAQGELGSAPASRFYGESQGRALVVRYREDEQSLCFAQSAEGPNSRATWFLALRAGNRGATTLHWALPAGTRRITLRLRVPGGARRAQDAEELQLRAGPDGEHAQALQLRSGDAARELALELQEPALELRVESQPSGLRSPWLLIDQAHLE